MLELEDAFVDSVDTGASVTRISGTSEPWGAEPAGADGESDTESCGSVVTISGAVVANTAPVPDSTLESSKTAAKSESPSDFSSPSHAPVVHPARRTLPSSVVATLLKSSSNSVPARANRNEQGNRGGHEEAPGMWHSTPRKHICVVKMTGIQQGCVLLGLSIPE